MYNLSTYPSHKKYVLLLVIVASVLRLIVANAVEFGNDEVYYWTYSQHLQWNYFDHPPMVAIWIRLFTCNLLMQQYEVFVRLGSIVSAGLCTWLLYLIGRQLHSERAGWIAACLYTASIYASIIAGLFIMPDSPQMVFWCWSLWLIVKICKDETKWSYWLLFGLSTGLCIMSKVHGLFLWFGLGLFILTYKRAWLKLPQLYVSAVVTAVIISPILFWNIQNHFITYRYHSERITVHNFSLNTDGILREFFGQILYNNPVNVVLIGLAFLAWQKHQLKNIIELSVYQFIAVPMALLLLLIALFRDTLPHWSGPAYVTLLPMASIYVAKRFNRVLPVPVRWSLGIIAFALIAGTAVINFYPGTIGKKNKEVLGTWDFTLDMYGWRKAGTTFDSLYKADLQKELIPVGAPVICYKWFPAAHEDYYFCHPIGIQMIGLGTAFDLHQYIWMNQWRKDKVNLNAAYCVVPSNEYYSVTEKYSSYYATIDSVMAIPSRRNGKLVRLFYLYRLKGWKGELPLPENIQPLP